MKKVFLALALAFGGVAVSLPSYSVVAPQTCDINDPCLYTGYAKNATGAKFLITVKVNKDGYYIAVTEDGSTYYVRESTTEEDRNHGTHYINVNSNKYYFNM